MILKILPTEILKSGYLKKIAPKILIRAKFLRSKSWWRLFKILKSRFLIPLSSLQDQCLLFIFLRSLANFQDKDNPFLVSGAFFIKDQHPLNFSDNDFFIFSAHLSLISNTFYSIKIATTPLKNQPHTPHPPPFNPITPL